MAQSSLSALISRELTSDVSRNSLRRLPAFKLDERIPARFDLLLRRLDQAEQTRNS